MGKSNNIKSVLIIGILALLSAHYAYGVTGSIVGWGRDHSGQASPPAGDPNDFVAMAAGYCHSIALKSDGSIVGWGADNYGQASPPAGDYVAIAAGSVHSIALKSDGSVVGWGAGAGSGYPHDGQASPPAGNDFAAIAAGSRHSLALVGCQYYALVGDVNNDCKFDFSDFAVLMVNWLIDCDQTSPDPACVPKY